MSAVRVRLYAALRDAADTSEILVRSDRLSHLLDVLRARFGEPFASRLSHASILVAGQPVSHEEDVSLKGGDEVVLLPPFSGG